MRWQQDTYLVFKRAADQPVKKGVPNILVLCSVSTTRLDGLGLRASSREWVGCAWVLMLAQDGFGIGGEEI